MNRGTVRALLAPVLIALLKVAAAWAQEARATTPRFEAVAVKACQDPGQARGAGGLRGATSSPGRLRTGCSPLLDLINDAYVGFADGHLNIENTPIHGGPAWLRSAFYEIDARAEGSPTVGTMMGPMLQVLLEERFQLKVHHETRRGPVYLMGVARGGAKLHPFAEGRCIPYSTFPRPSLEAGQEYCRSQISARSPASVEGQGATLDDLAKQLLNVVDRPVINKTGIAGRFDIRVEFSREGTKLAGVPLMQAMDGRSAAADVSGAATISTALSEQLGLKLEPGRGPVEALVIDRVERPGSN